MKVSNMTHFILLHFSFCRTLKIIDSKYRFGNWLGLLKFMFSKKATKIDEIFTIDLMLCSKRQIDGEDFSNFCGLLRKYEL